MVYSNDSHIQSTNYPAHQEGPCIYFSFGWLNSLISQIFPKQKMLSQNKLNVFFFVLIHFNITRDSVLQFWWWMLCYRGDFRCLLLTKISYYIRDKGVPGYGKLSQAHIHVGHRHWWQASALVKDWQAHESFLYHFSSLERKTEPAKAGLQIHIWAHTAYRKTGKIHLHDFL